MVVWAKRCRAFIANVVLAFFLWDSPNLRLLFFLSLIVVAFLIYVPNASVIHALFPVKRKKEYIPVLPKAGQLIHIEDPLKRIPQTTKSFLRVVTWNIECGFKIEKIIQHLEQLDADIIFLQEVDVGCVRSGFIDTGQEIASALGIPNLLFACEGPTNGGVQGNAILSRYPFVSTWVHELPCAKIGGCGASKVHATPCAMVQTPIGKVHLRSLHFDAYKTGILGRIKQWRAVEEDVRLLPTSTLCIFGGDLNTMANGFKRYQPWFCCDELRWKSIGYSESEWFQEKVFQNSGWHDPSMGIPTHKLIQGWFSAEKIDWILLRGLQEVENRIRVKGDDASDHCFICMDVEPRVIGT